MGLPYKKLTEQEDQMRNILDKGEYPFAVTAIERKRTKSGEYEMLVVDLSVMGNEGREMKVRDWIVFMDEMSWKFRHFAATCGLMDEYDNDTIEANDFINKNGVVKIGIAEYEKDGALVKTNRVTDYIKPGHAKAQAQNDVDASFNDDIKF